MEQQQISAKKLKAMEKVKRANAELAKVVREEKELAKQSSVSSPSEKETHRPQGSFHTPIRTELSGLEPGSGKRGGTTPASNRERDKA